MINHHRKLFRQTAFFKLSCRALQVVGEENGSKTMGWGKGGHGGGWSHLIHFVTSHRADFCLHEKWRW